MILVVDVQAVPAILVDVSKHLSICRVEVGLIGMPGVSHRAEASSFIGPNVLRPVVESGTKIERAGRSWRFDARRRQRCDQARGASTARCSALTPERASAGCLTPLVSDTSSVRGRVSAHA